MSDEKESDLLNFVKELKYRIEITKRARIKASSRLRTKHIRFEKVIHFYSILILILTIWFFGNNDFSDESTKFLLILSLTITFFSMYLNMQNYKERAGNFETNYQNLDILINRIERKLLDTNDLDISDMKQFQREYEKMLIDKENHIDIDYKKAFDDYQKSQARKKNKNNIDKQEDMNKGFILRIKEVYKSIQWGESFKYIGLWGFPIGIMLIIFIFEILVEKFL